MAPTSINCGAGTPTDSMTFATSLKWGILLPTAAMKKIVQSSSTTQDGQRTSKRLETW